MNPELERGALTKPLPGSGRAERRSRRIAMKQGAEAETHQQKLERVEFWRGMRLAVWLRDGGVCRACGLALDLDAPSFRPDSLHTHHLVHKSLGGLDVLDNLAALCKAHHKLHHDGRLVITGTVRTLGFVLKSLKGVIVRTWESAL